MAENIIDKFSYGGNTYKLQDNVSGYVTASGAASAAPVQSVNGNTGDITVQPTLVSGTNIKTINNESLLGSGNITISSSSSTDVQINGTSITSSGVANIITNTAYNASTNKIATVSDLPVLTFTPNSTTKNLTISWQSSVANGNEVSY